MADFIPTPDQANDAVDSIYGDQSFTLRQSVMAGQAMAPSPDVAAKALPLAQDNKIPLDMAVRNQPDLQKQQQFNAIPYEQLVKQYPQLSKFMSDPENAAIAHDDVGALSTVSGWAKSFLNDHYDMQAIGSTLGGLAQNFAASATHMAGESYHGLFQAAENAGASLDNYLQGEHPGLDPVDEFLLKSAAPALHDIGMVGSEAGKQVSNTGTAMDNANQGLLPGISRMVGGMGGAALNPLGMTAGFTTGMAGEGFDEAKKQGFDENSPQANATAALNAAMGFIMSKMGPEVIAKGIPAALQAKVTNGIAGLMAQAGVNPSGLAARLGYRAADATMRALSDAVAMGGQTIAQNAINQDVLGEKGTLTQGMGDTLEQGGVLGLMAGLIFHHTNMNFQPAMNEYRTQTLDAGRQFVADTKLQQRSPEKMNELLRSELGDRDVFINPGAAQTFYQSLKPDDRAALDKSMPDFGQHIEESKRTGEDLQIDQADYHTYIQQLEGSKNLDQWVKWVPDGTSEGDEKARAEFVKNLYSDYADAKDKGDPIQEEIYRQLIQRHGERAAVSGSPDIARLLSQNPADFYRTNLARHGEGARPILDQFISNLKFAREYPALQPILRGGADAQDLFIDKVRGDKAGAAEKVEKAKGAEFDQATGEKKKGYSPRGERAPTPVMDYLKGLGGVKKGSIAANDLIEAGLTRGQLQRLYSEKGIKGLDNLPVREFNDAVEEHGLEGKALPTNEGDTDAHYLDPEWLKGELSKEASGKGAKNKDQAAHDAATEDMLHVLDVMGIDFDKASNKQIKDALQAYSDSFGKPAGEKFYQPFSSSGDVIDNGTQYLIDKAKERGLHVSRVSQSENRIGGRSNYLSVNSDYTHTTVRVSDHSKNENFRTEGAWIIGTDKADIEKQIDSFLDRFSKSVENEKALQSKAEKLMSDSQFMKDYTAYKKYRTGGASEFKSNQRRDDLAKKYGLEEGGMGDLNKSAFTDKIEGKEPQYNAIGKPTGEKFYQSAFHGSPHKFDKFTLDHIGSGEGAQAYGWGLYFAGDKQVAEYYREKLSETSSIEQLEEYFKPGKIVQGYGGKDRVISFKKDPNGWDWSVTVKRVDKDGNDIRGEYERTHKTYPRAEELKRSGIKLGQIYEAEIPDKENMLDWDKPLDEQPEIVKSAIPEIIGQIKKSFPEFDEDKATGKGLYLALKDHRGGNAQTASEALNALGVKGISYLDGNSRKNGDGHHNSVVFDDSAIKTLKTFYQGGDETPRGSITFPPDGSPLIHLFEKENLSTVLHEYGHLYWHTLDALGKLDTASPQLKADINAVREWVGAEGADKLTVEQEEKIADGFLTYLRDNEAPSAEVRSSFQRFKSWLSGIYQGARDTLPSITPHVKEVFDRMFATDDEIQRMRDEPVFEMDPRLSQFLTEAQKATAQRKLDRMVGEASERLFRKAMKQSEEKGTDEYKAAREAVSAETQERISQEPRYQALAKALEKGLDRKKAMSAYGEYGKEAMEYLKQHRGLFKKDGVNPEVVAALHGFNSARDMLDAFQKMEPRKDYAERLTDEEMVARHGDMLKDGTIEREAVNAYHNGMRAHMLEWEMKQLAALAKVPTPGGQQIAIKAKQIINDRLMSEIIPSRFYRAEVTAARKSGEAVGKKNFEAAAIAKAQQLLNHHLYQEALAARDMRDDNISKWKKKLFKADDKLAKTMDMDFVQAARAILGAHGIGSGKFDFDKWFAHLSTDDPETYNTMREIIESANLGTAKPIKDMTFGEFQGLSDNINALIHVGSDSKTITIAGQRLDRRQAVQSLTDMLANQKGSGIASGLGGKIPEKDLNKKSIMGLGAYIRRTENLLTAYDGYKMDGPFRKLIWDPIKAAAESYRDARDKALREALDLLTPHLDRLMGDKISAPELVSDKTGEQYVFENKAELVGMLQHLGNGFEPGSNGYKLLRGYGWDPGALQQFLDRAHKTGIITKEDWDLIQKVWDMYEGQKSGVWKAHREMKGYYPSEIDAVPFKTPFGEYKGGYAPATPDRTKSSAIEEKELKNQITNEDNNFAFPTTGRGATMQRAALAAYPLEMNLKLLPKHLEWTVKFTHIEPVIKQVAKIMFDREFKEGMDRVNPAAVGELLVPWMQRTARQSMNMQSDKQNLVASKVTSYLRRNNQLQALGFNPIYMAQRIGSLGPMFQTTGFKHTMAALGDLMRNHGEMKAQIKDESAFMRHRNNTADENVSQAMSRILVDRSTREKVRDWATDHGYIIQHMTHQFLDLIQYTAGKYQAQAGEAPGVDAADDTAVQKYAEKSVRYTQGSFHPEDASRVEASGNWWTKLGTVFYGIMNTQGNMLYDEAQKIKQSDKGAFSKGMSGLYLYTMGYAAPSMVAASVMAAVKGGTPQDETPEKFWLETLLGSQVSYGMGMLPWVRDLANPIINKLEDRPYQDQVALGGNLADFMQKVFVETPGDLKDYLMNGKSGAKVLNDLITDTGYAAQVPVTPIRRAVNYAVGVHKGTQKAQNAGQVIRGVIGGPEPKK